MPRQRHELEPVRPSWHEQITIWHGDASNKTTGEAGAGLVPIGTVAGRYRKERDGEKPKKSHRDVEGRRVGAG
jgi:hypothetical protein